MSIFKPSLPEKKLKILLVGVECSPYAAVGGVASVLSYLSKALIALGHDVCVFIPKYGFIDESLHKLELLQEGLKVPTGDPNNPYLICNVKKAQEPNGAVTYFLENQEYYEKRANVYGYSDDPTRWALLSRGVLEFIKTKEFVPDVIHANDWQNGFIPNYLKTTYAQDPLLSKIACLFTIHNLQYQGMFDHKHVSELDFDDGTSEVASFFAPRLNTQNFMKRGILHADAINTVSKTYSREILTHEFGEGLDKLLIEVKEKLFGIVNGLDYTEFDPATDRFIEKNYDLKSLELRAENKKALQKEYNLPVDENALLLGFVGRLGFQKGVDLIIRTLFHLLKDYNVQFVQVGGGDGHLVEMLHDLKSNFPDKVGIYPHTSFNIARLLFGGCDCILYPSRFEPCGIVQIESMRYGAIPIVREVGGLADTVEGFNTTTMKGNGFTFKEFNEFSLFGQIIRAVELFKIKKIWRAIQVNAMKSDFSWEYSAKEYERVYEIARSFKDRSHPNFSVSGA